MWGVDENSIQLFLHNSCQQLLKADENKNQHKELTLGKHINFTVYSKISVEFFFK